MNFNFEQALKNVNINNNMSGILLVWAVVIVLTGFVVSKASPRVRKYIEWISPTMAIVTLLFCFYAGVKQ